MKHSHSVIKSQRATLVATGVFCVSVGVLPNFLAPLTLLACVLVAVFLGYTIFHNRISRHATSASSLRVLIFFTYLTLPIVRWEPAPFELWVLVLLGVLLIAGSRASESLRLDPRLVLLSISYGLSQMLSVGLVPNQLASFRHLLITFLMLFIVLSASLIGQRWLYLRAALSGYVTGAGVTTALALVLYAGYLSVSHSNSVQYGMRLRAFFKDPNVFAPFLVFPIYLLLDSLLSSKPLSNFGPRILRVSFLLLLLLGILLASSRAAWLGLGAGFIVYFLLRYGISLRGVLLLAVGSALAAIIAAITLRLLPLSQQQLLHERAGLQKYDQARFATQRISLYASRDEILFGHGPLAAKFEIGLNPHNTYVLSLYESGILGASLFAAIVLPALFYALYTARFSGYSISGQFAAVLAASLIAVLANSLFIDSTHWRHLWVLLGLAWAVPFLSVDHDSEHNLNLVTPSGSASADTRERSSA